MPSIFDSFTTHYKQTIVIAYETAVKFRSSTVELIHILAGLSRQKGSLAYELLTRAHINEEKIWQYLTLISGQPLAKTSSSLSPEMSETCQKILIKSVVIATEKKNRYIGTEHLLAAIMLVDKKLCASICYELNADFERLQNQIQAVLRGSMKFSELTSTYDTGGMLEEAMMDHMQGGGRPPMTRGGLETYAVELTTPAKQKEIDAVIGRETEIERMIHILCRRFKNNPLLVGDPGVGKTAIVEGLAKKIFQGDVPEVLMNKKVWQLDLGSLIAGTIYRGEYEARLKNVLDDIKEDPNNILFIDEVHNVIGTGSASGSLDTANLLKPAMARGEIRLIGATTFQEYKKHIASDAAFERRMQMMLIDEPSPLRTVEILRGIKENYEKFHHVTITDEALSSAVTLSERYLHERYLPDKAIDLIDEASAELKVKKKLPSELKEMRQLESDLLEVRKEKHHAVLNEQFSIAQRLKTIEEKIVKHLGLMNNYLKRSDETPKGEISEQHIRQVVARITGVPVNQIEDDEKKTLLGLAASMKKSIVGQNEAIEKIARVVHRGRLGLSNPNRPVGSFLLVGPSGVGKTETAKVLAKLLFDKENALIRIDMSEFAERFNVSKLVGAPAGYVGYKETNTLTDQVRKNPYSIVLFDEIEKAHSEVYALLLQILEDGRLTDAAGSAINFKNTIIILTSNIGQHLFQRSGTIGFKSQSEQKAGTFPDLSQEIIKELEKKFRPEFLNRLDQIIPFAPLTVLDLEKIVQLQLTELMERLLPLGLSLNSSAKVCQFIAQKSFHPMYGARSVRKNIQEMVENKLSELLLSADLPHLDKKSAQKIFLKTRRNEIVVEKM